jgi:hypothetical protein
MKRDGKEGVAAANPRSLYGFFISAGTAHPEAAWRGADGHPLCPLARRR